MQADGIRAEIPPRNIVLATDFSVAAQRATKLAAELARGYGSSLHLVSVVNLNAPFAAADVSLVLPIKELISNAQAGLSEIVTSLPDIVCTSHVVEGFSVSEAILDLAKSCKASLIVLGTTSKPIAKKMFLGSTAEEVLRLSKLPVLTVGPNVAEAQGRVPFQRIVVADDPTDRTPKPLMLALAFAGEGAHLELCRVLPDPAKGLPAVDEEALLRRMKDSVPQDAAKRSTVNCVIAHGDVAPSILSLAGKTHADLIALGARKATSRPIYLERTVTPSVIAEAKCPVLSYSPD